MARRTQPVDDVWALFQTRTVRDIAKSLKVDRRTVQRWKNQGQVPVERNDSRLHKLAAHDRRQFREYARRPTQRLGIPPLDVFLFGKRQYVTEEIKPSRKIADNRAAWNAERARSRELGRVYDRFYKRKDKRGRTRFFRQQDGGAVVFDTRRARESDLLTMLRSFQGEGRAIVLVHALTKEYKMKDGTLLPVGTHMGSRPEALDGLDLERFVRERKRKGRLIFARIMDIGTA